MAQSKAYRVLLVTFDLTDTAPGDVRYRQADSALAMYGDVFRPIKQLRLVITRMTSQGLRASLEQRIGRDVSIFVTPIKSIPAWRIYGAAKRREWRRFVDAVAIHGIKIQYLARDIEGGA